MPRKALLVVAVIVIAIAAAATCDESVARAMHEHGVENFLRSHKLIRETLKAPGWFGFTIVLAAIVAFSHRARWRASLFLILATVPAALNQAIKSIVGRTRPYKIDALGTRLAPFEFHPFRDGKNLCF